MARASRFWIVVLFILLELAHGAPNEEKEIQALYRRGLLGDKAAVAQCIEKLETVLRTEPTNQFARVYLGSAYTLRSRDLGFGPKKLAALKHGLALMDEAVAAASNDPKVRLARALTTSALPAIFARGAASREDFATLAEMADALSAKFDEGDLQIVYYRAGLAADDAREHTKAVALWKKASAHPADPALTQKIEEALKR